MEAELKEKVKTIVRNTLQERFADAFIFDPIVVIPEIDEYGDDYFHIMIVFDGDQANLSPRLTGGGFIRCIHDQMKAVGIDVFPVPSFIVKSEWKFAERKLKKLKKLDYETA